MRPTLWENSLEFSASIRAGNSGGAVVDDSGVLVGVAVAGYNPVKTFIATGHTTVLANVAEWSDAVNLLLPANWSPRNPPVLHLREEAVKNLQTATVELRRSASRNRRLP